METGSDDHALPHPYAGPLLRLDETDHPWAAFGEVTSVAFDSAGHLFILDGQARRVFVSNLDGTLVRTVGGPGDGPGEFRFPSGMVVHPDGAVTVLDPGHGGFVVFDDVGGYRWTRPVDREEYGLPPGPLSRHPSGAIVSRGEPDLQGRTDASVPRFRPVGIWWDRLDGADRWFHQAWRPPLPEAEPLTPEETSGFTVRLPPLVGFHPELLVAPLPDGRVAVVDSFAYHIELVDLEGRVGTVLERPVDPLPADERLIAAERAARLAALQEDAPRMVLSNREGDQTGVVDDRVYRLQEARIRKMGFHEKVPVIQDLMADPEGRIWVQRVGALPSSSGRIDLLARDGRYLGTFPDRTRLPSAFGPRGLVAFVTRAVSGVPTVEVRRLN